jgi:hypothetical protein
VGPAPFRGSEDLDLDGPRPNPDNATAGPGRTGRRGDRVFTILTLAVLAILLLSLLLCAAE